MSDLQRKRALRERRRVRIRSKIEGTAERPRLSVFRSPKHVYAQIIDDIGGRTLASIGSFKKGQAKRASKDECMSLGKELAKKCLALNISKIVFDKNGYAYHGRVKALADGARDGGLTF